MEMSKEDDNFVCTIKDELDVEDYVEHKNEYFLQDQNHNRGDTPDYVNKDDCNKLCSTRNKFNDETDYEAGREIKHFVKVEGHAFSGLQVQPRDFSMLEEVNNKVDIIKVEDMLCEVKEEAVEVKRENLTEMVDQKFLTCDNGEVEIKTDQANFDGSQPPEPHGNFDKNNLGKQVSVQGEAMLQCDSCSYQTKFRKFLIRHVAIHKNPSDITMFQCEYCPYQSRYRSIIAHHVLQHKDPSEVTMHKCDSCPFRTKYKRHLITHSMKHKNPSEKPIHQCDSCTYQTNFRRLLARHTLIHHQVNSNITMFHCASCSFQTKYKHHLKRHVLSHRK